MAGAYDTGTYPILKELSQKFSSSHTVDIVHDPDVIRTRDTGHSAPKLYRRHGCMCVRANAALDLDLSAPIRSGRVSEHGRAITQSTIHSLQYTPLEPTCIPSTPFTTYLYVVPIGTVV